MSHALVIGGTGMLGGAAIHLLNNYDHVTVIARGEEGFKKLSSDAEENSSKLNFLRIDYNNYKELTDGILECIKNKGPVELTISWIHSTAQLAPMLAAKIINETSTDCRFFEVMGSSNINPETYSRGRDKNFSVFSNLEYHKVILGFVTDGSNSRWLTNKEISGGVMYAIEEDLKEFTVGVVTPWSLRPG
ncbi:MAG: hypothetical protein K8I03_02330 [Ignavibacteria bacterium]|nr:hypothetical protein [Ignavibacteria bacterium]